MRNRRHVMNCLAVLQQQIKQCYLDGKDTSLIGLELVLNDIHLLAAGVLSKQSLRDSSLLSVSAISKRIRGEL
jgi:hypothetical protein